MTRLKDKLSASVRQAKAVQQTTARPAARKPAPAKAASRPATQKTPAAVKPVAKSQPAPAKAAADQSKAPVRTSVSAESTISPLYPNRVWPD